MRCHPRGPAYPGEMGHAFHHQRPGDSRLHQRRNCAERHCLRIRRDLLRDAEIAMYRAKQTGKGSFEIFDPTKHKSAFQRLKLETDIRKGLEQGEFKVFYQPIVSLKNGRIVGFEALSRWKRPKALFRPTNSLRLLMKAA